ncbi:hypothetical protein GOP47_0022478 [Adiantum capillus-veneris]|uniref:Uncharacterized protein n=1 Tax=Adiantum capillus-veneris TaxID=13818 RepID=A0A9D4U5F0_ADICA|nr:hypothetical protein GOP47_0022478 [Adiantum capillus-veneris]
MAHGWPPQTQWLLRSMEAQEISVQTPDLTEKMVEDAMDLLYCEDGSTFATIKDHLIRHIYKGTHPEDAQRFDYTLESRLESLLLEDSALHLITKCTGNLWKLVEPPADAKFTDLRLAFLDYELFFDPEHISAPLSYDEEYQRMSISPAESGTRAALDTTDCASDLELNYRRFNKVLDN